MKHDIAVIGMSGRFPLASDIQAIHAQLRSGGDAVTPISKKRICNSTLPLLSTGFRPMGWLDNVDHFDYKYFNISRREAEQIDPHQRIMMESAVECIESAGYSAGSVDGSRMLVLGANADYHYYKLFDHFEPAMFSGNTPFSIAGRISRYLNTKAPAWVSDTGCSTALFLVVQACDYLRAGLGETALVVASRIMLDPIREGLTYDVGVTSDDSKTRTFNADSVGSGSSEAVTAVMLKPLEKAIADDDNIWAVIRAGASNSSGNSAASLTATSSVAQTEVMLDAWRNAEVDPRTITYIEPHGSATRLGDPIEVAAIDKAMRRHTDDKHFCALTCVKTNIGHTDKVAGMAGMLKAVLSLRHGELYPSLHFEKPNPFIDFANSATFVNTGLTPWQRWNGEPLRAGVSSWGFAGNNVHVLLEEAPERPADTRPREAAYPVCISSKRADGVGQNINKLREHLAEYPGADVADIAFTLNTGRGHFRYRCVLVARSTEELYDMLQHVPTDDVSFDAGADESGGMLFICSSNSGWTRADIELQADIDSDFKQALEQFPSGQLDASLELPACATLVGQFCAWHSLKQRGVLSKRILGLGAGDISVRLILNELAPAAALEQARGFNAVETPADMRARVERLVDRESADGKVLFVELGPAGELSQALDAWQPADRDVMFDVLRFDPRQYSGAAVLTGELYSCRYAVDWQAWHQDRAGRRIHLPSYQFEGLRVWARPAWTDEEYEQWQASLRSGAAPLPQNGVHNNGAAEQDYFKAPDLGPAIEAAEVDESWSPTEQRIARIWQAVLKIEAVKLDDDFFSLGGHSLFGTMVTSRIEQEFNIRLQFKDILTFSTVRRMAAGVDERLAGRTDGVVDLHAAPIEPAPEREVYELSYSQRPMWIINQVEGGENLAYNLVSALRVEGEIDVERLEQALRLMVARHEVFRTSFVMTDDGPRQRVAPTVEFELETLTAADDGIEAAVHDFTRPFNLERAPMLRVALLQLDSGGLMLVFDVHHIVFDGTSAAIFTEELAALYRGEELPRPELHYKDFARWQAQYLASPAGQAQGAWWRAQFADAPRPLELPTDFPRPARRGYAGSRSSFVLSSEQAAAVNEAARRQEATLFMFLLSAFYAMLHRYSGQNDIVVGTPVAGRNHVQLERMPGMFVNTLALRARPRATQTFAELLAEVKQMCLESYAHQEYPIELLVEDLEHERDASRSPLFDVMLLLQNVASTNVRLDENVSLRHHDFAPRTAKFDLSFEFVQDEDRLILGIEYSTDLFRAESIKTMADDYIELLNAVTINADLTLTDVPVGVRYNSIDSDSDAEFGEF